MDRQQGRGGWEAPTPGTCPQAWCSAFPGERDSASLPLAAGEASCVFPAGKHFHSLIHSTDISWMPPYYVPGNNLG